MPTFTKHHYNILAKEIRGLYEIPQPADGVFYQSLVRGRNDALSQLVLRLCTRFAADNPNFDFARFTKAAIPADIIHRIIEDATNV